MSLVAMAAIVATLVLTPVFWESEAVVDLPPIVVQRPAAQPAPVIPVPSPPALVYLPFQGQDLWTRSNSLLYEYSSLYQRYREPNLVRTGLR